MLSCYYIEARCLFKFSGPAVAAHYSPGAASAMGNTPAAWLPLHCRQEASGAPWLLWAIYILAESLDGTRVEKRLDSLFSSISHIPLSHVVIFSTCPSCPFSHATPVFLSLPLLVTLVPHQHHHPVNTNSDLRRLGQGTLQNLV